MSRKDRLYREGRLAFRSATEKDAFEIAHLPTAKLRAALPTEKRIKALMIALDHLERNRVVHNAELVRERLQQLCAKENTAVTICFVDGGQDFFEWDLNAEGCVIDSRPFQVSHWGGSYVMNYDKLRVGGRVIVFMNTAGKLTMNYKIKALRPGPAPMKYPDHKPRYQVLHERKAKR